jgi:hypothetical protein
VVEDILGILRHDKTPYKLWFDLQNGVLLRHRPAIPN